MSTMRNRLKVIGAFFALSFTLSIVSVAAEHPNLVLTQQGVTQIREALGTVPLFDASLAAARKDIDAEIASGIDTPVPFDYSGGYTHERHKRNFFAMQKAGVLYQILEDEKYARYVRDMLFQYEAMYKDLPLHPKTRSYARGKLFWQCLNDANWLVYTSQAYDTIYNFLSAEERRQLEDNLFRPFADHISVANPRFFNRIHNHSTWGNAGVGMIGLVMGDDELVERALYGLSPERFDFDAAAKDDDGGFIFDQNGQAGFLANLAAPFSPDGYYTEGPYYQRYAMYPFLIFAQGLHNIKPELDIFARRDGLLLNAVNALLQLSDADGEFFPLNDGQKGMSYHARSLVSAVDIAYLVGDNDPRLLSIAEAQNQVLLDDAGIAVALAIRDGKAQPFNKASVNLRDGSDGTEGGVAVLRHTDEAMTLVFKYAAQGLSHGHYDKLSFSLHERGGEVLQDYGLARFVNIEQKGGGNYLPENKTWAKQSIAHNTLTLDETSHFGGSYDIGSQHHSELYFYDDTNRDVQVVSATESNAYPGTILHRTMAVIKNTSFTKPFMLDIFRAQSDAAHRYDMPFYFHGQVLDSNFEFTAPTTLAPVGERNGYQHLYLEAQGAPAAANTQLSWMNDRRFFTLTTTANETDTLMFTRIGANDPDFNLRRDPGFMIRRDDTRDTLFVSTVEFHGSYDPVSERAVDSRSNIAALTVLHDDDDYTVVSIEDVKGSVSVFALSNNDASQRSRHSVKVAGKTLRWSGPYHYFTDDR
ncbi:MAG: alginate lyase family protein [Pseudomonadota bacterium]